MSVEVIVDVNEPKLLIKALEAQGFTVKVEQIRFGSDEGEERIADIIGLPRGSWGVERKTVEDFASSCFNKRIFRQIKKMSSAFAFPFLLIEGDLSIKYEEFKENGKPYLDNFLRSTIIKANAAGVYCWIEPTIFDLAKSVKFINKYASEFELKDYVPKLPSFEFQQITTLCTIPGIGEEKAKNILWACGGKLVKVARASVTFLSTIPGIGEKLAQQIYNHFHEKCDVGIKNEIN